MEILRKLYFLTLLLPKLILIIFLVCGVNLVKFELLMGLKHILSLGHLRATLFRLVRMLRVLDMEILDNTQNIFLKFKIFKVAVVLGDILILRKLVVFDLLYFPFGIVFI